MRVIKSNDTTVQSTLEKFVDSVKDGYALVRSFKGEVLICNKKYLDDFRGDCIRDAIERSDSAIDKANLTFCNHLDRVFSKTKKTFLSEEELNFKNWCSLRTLVSYKGEAAILILINEI